MARSKKKESDRPLPVGTVAASVRLANAGKKDLDKHIEALISKFTTAQFKIEAVVTRAVVSGRLNALKYRRDQTREVQKILATLREESAKQQRRVVKDAFRLGTRVAQKGGAGTGPGQIQKEAVDLLTDNLKGRLDAATQTVGRRADDVFRREGLRLAATKLSKRQTVEEATHDLVKRLTRAGATSFEDRAGKQWSLEAYARMAVQTVASEAINLGTETVMLARDLDVARVSKSRNPCDLCKTVDGKLVSLTGRSKKYPRLKRRLPLHPRCEHILLVDRESLEEREEWRRAQAA